MTEQNDKHGGMANRGATRPDMGSSENGNEHDQMEQPSEQQRMHMLAMHHRKTLWIYWMLVLLGFWTMFAPFSFGYDTGLVSPAGGRQVWLSQSARVTAMTWSDIISGVLLVMLGFRTLKPNRPYSLWAACFVGVWMSFAPLLFWSPSAAGYLNDTFVGALVIALTILIPGMPNLIHYMKMGHEKTPGWSYNPSSWPQRWVMIALGFAGWLVARYVAMFQLGYIDTVWDPFFGEGSRTVLTSDMSRSLPISDGALGAFAYTFEFLMGWMGSQSRWRTMPWMVTFFGILVIPLGTVHILLVASQPIVVGSWCTMCLLAAAIMLPMIPLEVDEVIAMGQFMVQAKRRGQSLWSAFWKGGIVPDVTPEKTQPDIGEFLDKPLGVIRAGFRGVSFPWTLAISVALGVWVMVSPEMLGSDRPMASIHYADGALLITFSVFAMGEPIRAIRWLNVPLSVLLIVATWTVPGATLTQSIIDTIVAAARIALAIPRGPKTETYGLWDRFVK